MLVLPSVLDQIVGLFTSILPKGHHCFGRPLVYLPRALLRGGSEHVGMGGRWWQDPHMTVVGSTIPCRHRNLTRAQGSVRHCAPHRPTCYLRGFKLHRADPRMWQQNKNMAWETKRWRFTGRPRTGQWNITLVNRWII